MFIWEIFVTNNVIWDKQCHHSIGPLLNCCTVSNCRPLRWIEVKSGGQPLLPETSRCSLRGQGIRRCPKDGKVVWSNPFQELGDFVSSLFVTWEWFNESRCKYDNLDLPKGAEWMIRGAYTPSLRVQTAPFGRCWNVVPDVQWCCMMLRRDTPRCPSETVYRPRKYNYQCS